MSRLVSKLFTLFLPLAGLTAYAIDAANDAPAETANPLVVIGFLVLFVGSCAGYVGYLLWSGRRKAGKDK